MRPMRKMFTFSSHVLFYYLVWHFAVPDFGFRSSSVSSLSWGAHCLVLSTIFLAVTYGLFVHILRTYGNIFSRLLAMETLAWGVPLSVVALYVGPDWTMRALSSASLVAWLYFAYRYQRNTRRYEKQGAGPVPVDTCVRIPVELPQPGDAI